MGSEPGKEDTRTKVALLLLDKLFLALLLAGAGFFFNFLLQQEKTRGDYQKQIYDRRVQAYVTILEEAKHARDQLAFLYGVQSQNSANLGELSREFQFEGLLQRSESLDSLQAGFTPSSHRNGYKSHSPVIQTLTHIEQVALDNDLYISQRVRERLNEFLDVTRSDLVTSLDIAERDIEAKDSNQTASEGSNVPDDSFRQSAWQRAEQAYQLLLGELRESLRIEGIPLG